MIGMCCLLIVMGVISALIALINFAIAVEEDETDFETDEEAIDELEEVKVPLVISLVVTLVFILFTIATICFYNSMVNAGYAKKSRKNYLAAKLVGTVINLIWVILTLIASPNPGLGVFNAIVSASLALYILYLVYKFYALKQEYFIINQLVLVGGQQVVLV
jgi:hypothetical protein